MKRNINKKFLPFILMFIILLFLHFFMNFSGDDLWFSKQLNLSTYSNYIVNRYNSWSSRIIIEILLISITNLNIIIWRIIDTIMYVLCAYVLLKLVNKNNNLYINCIGCCLFLIYPFTDLSSAGWAATTMNYLWCFTLGMISFIPIINKEQNKNTKKILYPFTILSLLYATNQEQMCAIIFGFNLLYLIKTIYKKEKIDKYNIICLLISLFSMLFIFVCPGNSLRKVSEISTWYPDYAKYGILQKIYLGVVSTADILISNKIILFTLVSMLSLGCYLYSKKDFSKIIAALNFMFISCITIFKSTLIGIFPVLENVYNVLSYQGIPSISDKFSLIPFFVSIIMVLNIICMLLVIFKTDKLLPLFIFLAGICSRLIMGFSPTIFVSGSRTAFFLYMSVISVIIFVIKKLYDDNLLNKKNKIIMATFMMYFAIVNCISIFISV